MTSAVPVSLPGRVRPAVIAPVADDWLAALPASASMNARLPVATEALAALPPVRICHDRLPEAELADAALPDAGDVVVMTPVVVLTLAA